MTKPNCYQCKHQGSVPGSAHSSCRHPSVAGVADDPLDQILGMLGSVGRGPGLVAEKNPLNVQGNAHGVRMGWFNWPINFDPVWLERCDGFEEKETKPAHDMGATGERQ